MRALALVACLWGATAGAAGGSVVVDELIAESKQGNTWDYWDYKHPRPLSDEELARALDYVRQHPDAGAYHALLAIKKRSPDEYRKLPPATRAQVLCAALARLTYLNDWGHIRTPSEGPSSQALIETGEAALSCLSPLLDDRRAAPFYGSADVGYASLYRRCDFAHYVAARILGERSRWSDSEEQRDRAITQLKARLAAHPKPTAP